MANNQTVHVKNIASSTKEEQVKEFFSFCGKITELHVTKGADGTQEATVTFEKETAAKTAQLLDSTLLDSSQISVTPAGESSDESPHTTNAERDSDEITQEEKPRSRILAEYLAHGYVIGDAAIQRAIDLDHTHGVTTRFMNTLTQLDQKFHATDRAKAADQSYKITTRAGSIYSGLTSYFEKASNTPTGQKLVKFYTEGQRQAQDIHAEAQRLMELKKEEAGGSSYKAAGLERVFGKEKEKTGESATPESSTTKPAGTESNLSSAPAPPQGDASYAQAATGEKS